MAGVADDARVGLAMTGRWVASSNLPLQTILRRSNTESNICAKKEEMAEKGRWKISTLIFCTTSIFSSKADDGTDILRFLGYYYEKQLLYGSPPWHIRDQLDAFSSVFSIQINASLSQSPPFTPKWLSIDFPGDEKHEFYNVRQAVRKRDRILILGGICILDQILTAVLRKEISAKEGRQIMERKMSNMPRKFLNRRQIVSSFFCCALLSSMLFGGHLNDIVVSGMLGVVVKFVVDFYEQKGSITPRPR